MSTGSWSEERKGLLMSVAAPATSYSSNSGSAALMCHFCHGGVAHQVGREHGVVEASR